MSSRNAYLSSKEQSDATILSRALKKAIAMVDDGIRSAETIIAALSKFIESNSNATIDYVSIVEDNMRDVTTIQDGNIVALALYVGKTRLIDNHIIGDPLTF